MNFIRYNLHDRNGNKIASTRIAAKDHSRITLEYNGVCYRPINYCFTTKSACCVPTPKYILGEDDENTDGIGSTEKQLVVKDTINDVPRPAPSKRKPKSKA